MNMSKYVLNKNQQDSLSGEHYELHNENICEYLPNQSNRLSVGLYDNCTEAKLAAKNKYPTYASRIDGCYWCCKNCHTG
jgi:hypothetical protein